MTTGLPPGVRDARERAFVETIASYCTEHQVPGHEAVRLFGVIVALMAQRDEIKHQVGYMAAVEGYMQAFAIGVGAAIEVVERGALQ